MRLLLSQLVTLAAAAGMAQCERFRKLRTLVA